MIELTDARIQKYLTPYRYNKPVLTASGEAGAFDEQAVDIPFVFKHAGRYWMLHTGFDGKGYQTALATSSDLLHWQHHSVALPRLTGQTRWDAVGASGTWIIKESDDINAVPTLRKIDGKYWMVYHAYPMTGYEQGPAEIGLAWCDNEDLLNWQRLEQPVFSWKDGGSWECGGLYKACIIEKDGLWHMYYNAKDKGTPWIEQTGLATGTDLMHWTRCPQNPVLTVTPDAWDRRFVSDPYIVHDGDLWLNFFFGLGPGHAQEGLALSADGVHWEKVKEPIIGHGAPGSLDAGHAHKASIFMENGRLYHFYCATRPWQEGDTSKIYNEFRTIAVASNRPFDA